MSEAQARHMDQTELLTYADGELHPSEAAAAEKHLAGCVECRLRLEQLRSDLDDLITRHRERKIAAVGAGAAWADLNREFDRLDGKRESRARVTPLRAWIGIAAAAFVAAVVWNLATQRTVSAAELLTKASAREPSAEPNRRIVITTRGRSFLRMAQLGTADGASELKSLFEQANFSWENPLSARSFARWREQLPQKQDQVSLVETGSGRLYRIRTATSHGVLTEATLMMRVVDLRAVRETLRFRERELVEIAEVAPAEPAAPETRIATEQPAAAETPVGPAEELRVLAALNQIGADLGDPVEVKRDDANNRLTISGVGVDAARQQQIKNALRDIPGVVLEFTDPQPVDVVTSPEAPVTAARRSPLHAELETRLGAGDRVDAFVDRLLAASETGLARAHALRNLAARFPPPVEQTLPAGDRRILDDLRARHLSALVAVSESIERDVAQVFGSSRSGAARACTAWQECAAAVVSASQRFDETLNATLAGTGREESGDAAKLVAALAAWRQQITTMTQVQ